MLGSAIDRTRIIPLKVNDDITVMVEAKDLAGEQDVSTLSFQGVIDTIEAVTQALASSINKTKLQKAIEQSLNHLSEEITRAFIKDKLQYNPCIRFAIRHHKIYLSRSDR